MKNISYKYLMKISRKNIPQNHLVKYPAKLSRKNISQNISQKYLTKSISFRGISEFRGKSGIIEF